MNKLMEGVTVLNQTEIIDVPIWVFIGTIVSLSVLMISAIICFSASNEIISNISAVATILALVSCAIFVLLSVFIKEPTGEYTYDCLISEDVTLTEFYEKYEVLEVNGQIWTIKEK